MKILILANNDVGLYNFRKELIEKLIKLKNDIYISLPYGERVEDLKKLGCKFFETYVDRRGTNPIKDIKLLMKYKKLIKKIEPDIVLTYTIKPNIYGGIVCRFNKISYICNVTGLGSATEKESVIQKVILFLYKIALKNVKCCFVQNKENLQFLKNNKIIKKEEKYQLIPGSGVNLSKFKVLPYPKEKEKIKFLFISRIMKEKGIEEYLKLAKYMKNNNTNLEFGILGFCEQKYESTLKELQDQDIIYYYGMQKNVIPYLKECSCLIHPSYYPEGMSNVLLEASASGRPVITTNRSGCREIVEDKKTGFIVTSKDSEDLIKKVEQFINIPRQDREKMGLEARKKVEREFDRNIVIDEYLRKIKE